MHANDYIFPHRFTRRDFLKMTGVATAGLAVPSLTYAAEKQAPVRIGGGHHTYTLDEDWGKLPDGVKYGFGCGVIVDSQDRIYVTSRSADPCVAIFDRNGQLLETWSNDFADKVSLTTAQVADTAHCLYWSREGKEEFI